MKGLGPAISARLYLGMALAAFATVTLGALAALGPKKFCISAWSRIMLWTLGVRYEVEGQVPVAPALVASNHVSYLDIFLLGAVCPSTFVAKSEIRGWPVMGLAARAAGVLFVERDRARAAHRAIEAVAAKLSTGGRVVIFPEGGIRGGGREVAEFKPMPFDAAIRAHTPVVPVCIKYLSPADPAVWAWTQDESPVEHAMGRLLPAGGVRVRVSFLAPLEVGEGEERKELALRTREAVARAWGASEGAAGEPADGGGTTAMGGDNG